MKKGFNLSEVLITLGVIGVVSAMILPIVIQNYKKHNVVSRLKQAYSTFGQVLEKSKIDNGSPEYWEIDNSRILTEKYFNPYLKGAKEIDRYDVLSLHKKGKFEYWAKNSNYPIYILPNGISYAVRKGTNTAIYIPVDINGPAKPNIAGKDVFVFVINANNDSLRFSGASSRDYAMKGDCACSKINLGKATFAGLFCGALIMLDGWKIKDDYPW